MKKQTFQIQTIPLDPDASLSENLKTLFKGADKLVVTTEKADEVNIEWSLMYDPPVLSPRLLFTLCNLFGTDDVDVDGFANRGCETCDYGSAYGHEFQIKGVTLNWKEAFEIKGINLFKQ